MYKHWGLHISTDTNCLEAILGSFWAVLKGLLLSLELKLPSWQFPRYWWFNKRYHGSYVTTLKSNSGCNTQVKTWGWIKSRGRKRMIQLVKHKEYRRVSTVYIPMYHEVVIRRTYGKHEVCWVKNIPHQWGADWAIRYMKWYETKKWSMWLHHGKHLYEMRSIITGYQLICLISWPILIASRCD